MINKSSNQVLDEACRLIEPLPDFYGAYTSKSQETIQWMLWDKVNEIISKTNKV